jgi:hypothetical protein
MNVIYNYDHAVIVPRNRCIVGGCMYLGCVPDLLVDREIARKVNGFITIN